ncbi:MAG TPA: DUF3137 domain-containing protein [Geminicoccaceae bacterium]|nr:DUF3137 domain-containing protein [Geminicoccaceae bacterium]
MSAATAGEASGLARLERRRRLTLVWALAAAALGLLCWPLALLIGEDGNETREVIGGAFVWLGLIGMIAAPWILRAWPRFMERHMLDEVARVWPDISHLDGERDHAARAALASEAFQIAAFQASGLAEPFASASVDHVLTGRSQGVPFTLAQLRLLNQEGYRVFGGVLASFRLPRPRPGLTIVTRERGLLGNLIARAGSGIERVALEDPHFEGVFEAYGFDQVQARVVLTTTMLEHLKALDELGHARGFTCAFRDEHLLIAFRGMRWRCAVWRVLQPVRAWLPGYRAWLEELIELPARIVATLDLHAPSAAVARPPAAAAPTPPGVVVVGSHTEVFSAGLWRLVGQGGIALVTIASGALFGGLAATFGWWWWEAGFEGIGGYVLLLIVLGLAYGAGAIATGLYMLARLAWTWGAPLRGIPARRPSGPPSDRVPNGLA